MERREATINLERRQMQMSDNIDWSMSMKFYARTSENGFDKDFYFFEGEILDENTLQAVKEAVLQAMIKRDKEKEERGW